MLTIQREGIVFGCWPPGRALPSATAADAARAIAGVVSSPPVNGVVRMRTATCSPERCTALIGRALGRPVQYAPVSLEVAAAQLELAGVPRFQAELSLLSGVGGTDRADGYVACPTTVEELL